MKALNLFLIFVLFMPIKLVGQSYDIVKFKSALIYNMLKYVQWPDESKLQFITIGFIGNDQALLTELQKASKNLKIKNKQVKVIKLETSAISANEIQLLYIDASFKENIPKIASQVRQTDTLLITEKSINKRDIMINLYPELNTLKFEVNSSNIVYENLKLHKDILLLGGTQLDVAKLLRESEDDLQNARVEIEKKQIYLKNQQALINKKTQESLNLQAQVTNQKNVYLQLNKKTKHQEQSLIKQNREFKALSLESNNISIELSKNQLQLDKKHAEFERTNQELEHRLKQLDENKYKMKALTVDIKSNIEILAKQKSDITQQNKQLDKKDVHIAFQQNLITVIIGILIIFICMIVVLFVFYKSKKQAQANLLVSYENIHRIANLGMEITASLNFNQAMETLYKHVTKLMHTSSFGIGIYNETTNSIDFDIAYENDIKYEPYSRTLEDKNQFAVYCLEHNKNVFINDVSKDYKHYIDNYLNKVSVGKLKNGNQAICPQSLIYIPILSQDQVQGVISVQSNQKNAYTQLHLDLLTTLSAYTSVALDNATSHNEIKNAQQQLVIQEKMASLGILTAGIAHEINNPTNFTQISAQNLQSQLKDFKYTLLELAGDDAEETVKKLFDSHFNSLFLKVDTILDGTERIKNTVQDLRTFTRQDSNEKCSVSLSKTLNSTVRLVRSKFKDDLQIECDIKVDANFSCWPAQLNQVFMNIIINACDAIQLKKTDINNFKGLVKITLESDAKTIWITFEDNGSGMSQDVQDKIFELFYTTKPLGEGTGLGLSISYGIIQKHQGEISVKSTLGEGSRFIITLPYS